MTFHDFLLALLSASIETAHAAPVRVHSPRSHASPDARPLSGPLPYIPGTLVYYSLDGTAAFRFRFEVQPRGGIRIHILEQPGYCGHSEESIPTHRIFENGHTFICFDPPPATTEDARRIARAWAELTLRYIRTGERF